LNAIRDLREKSAYRQVHWANGAAPISATEIAVSGNIQDGAKLINDCPSDQTRNFGERRRVAVTMTISLTELLHAARAVILLLPLVAPLPLSARSQASTPSPTTSLPGVQPLLRFEVASIRLHQSAIDEPSNRQMLPGGRFIATATTVRTLIRVAFGIDNNRISGAPNWIDSETFDIDATTENHAEVTNPQQFQGLILSLLEDRFQLKFHREMKEVPVYWLVLEKPGKPGIGLKPSRSDIQPNMSTNSSGSRAEMKASGMSMVDIASALSRQAGRPVEDHTGLQGEFDFKIEWAPNQTPDSDAPSLFTVLKEELGLRLHSAKGTTKTLIIDQITRPSPN